MLYKIIKNPEGSYKVINIINGVVHAESSNYENAKKLVQSLVYSDSKMFKR